VEGDVRASTDLTSSAREFDVVRLPPFRLHRPQTVEQASELLAELGPAALPYCGGTELLLVAKLGLTDFTDLIDVKGIDELKGIGADGELRIGAATTHREIERSAVVREQWPSFAGMERHVGNLRVRNVGTIGGNLCFADPHSDPATYLLAAGGSVTVRSGESARRRIPVEEFTRGPYQNALGPTELLVSVHVPQPDPGSALVHRKISFRERPAITVAAGVTVRDSIVAEARLVVGSIGTVSQRLSLAEQTLRGIDAIAPATPQLSAVARAAGDQAEIVADSNGSVEYKRQLVRVLVGRCVGEALANAQAPRTTHE
jgi:carbon-monoxide dehydrogenase medium subunit